ncbi:MAG: phytanoyl-CoA dioxygenase family protein [Planctomycetes bacterium]|nr:phytanoyl-CoA dioxygenase family protein [Planctomycetota bacterium]
MKGFRIFDGAGVRVLQDEYEKLVLLLPPGKNINFVNWWHKRNRTIYDLCTHPRILDYVECLLGPDFFLWGSHFFVKEPGDGTVVPWHQDAQYWPLSPMKAVTVFLAFTDCDRENACLRVVPGTHRGPLLRHRAAGKSHYILQQEILDGEFDPEDAVPIELKAGEISLHDDALVHGSGPNLSTRRRVGFTFRFSSTDVRCDLRVWPNFRAYMVRGVDIHHLNPPGVIPSGYGAPDHMMPE